MSVANVIAAAILAPHMISVFALWRRVEQIRSSTSDGGALPHPLAFWGPSIWAYVFSARHRRAKDSELTVLVMIQRATTLLLPIGIWAFAASN